jgi:hypothetical protein
MAARRLIVVMIVLLLASSVAAALVPIPESAQDDSSSTTTTTAAPTGGSHERTLRAAAGKPETIRLEVGDRLALEVVAQDHDLVEIAGLGQLEDVDAASPARFDLVLDRPGTYPVRLAGAGDLIGRIEVSQQGATEPDADQDPAADTTTSVS